MNKLFPIVLALMCFSLAQSDVQLPEESKARIFSKPRVTKKMKKNAEEARKKAIYQGIWTSISLCVSMFILIKVIIYLKRKRNEKLEEEIKKNEKFRKLEKRLNKLESK